ncbi:MAG: phosphotransferase [Proteobacteria bacterium]|nr:phosphotransferase [Pseudomonadota bacterium]
MADSAEHDNEWQAAATTVLQAYEIDAFELKRITQGLVNLTIEVTGRGGKRCILQRLNSVFDESVNHNIDAVTTHLAGKGMITPHLIRTRSGDLGVEHGDEIWRLLSFIEGRTLNRVEHSGQAGEAGSLLGRFHASLLDFDEVLHVTRPPIHDLQRHFARLRALLVDHADHRLHGVVSDLAVRLEGLRQKYRAPILGDPRLVHGDPKISNVLFAADEDVARCMIDLDTLTRMPLALELGDAFRSWCNPLGEDHPQAVFDLGLFEAALEGYARAARNFLTPDEISAIAPAMLEIYFELAARFLADAMEETYFAWDATRYATRGDHNLARARGQISAARSLAGKFDAAERLTSQILN